MVISMAVFFFENSEGYLPSNHPGFLDGITVIDVRMFEVYHTCLFVFQDIGLKQAYNERILG